MPFLLVVYLAMREGGYDQVVRGELGVAIWVILLLGALAGLLRIPESRTAWAGIGLITAFALWTGLASLWSESAERTAIEAARVAALLGVFVLALCTQRAQTLRYAVGGIGAAIALIATLSIGSRLLPDLFPANQVAEVLPTEQARLGYPLAYWNGLATMTAIGMPLLLLGAGCARSLRVRAAAVAWLPVLALTIYFTLSRGGVVEAAIGIGALALLMPRRLRIVVPGLIAARRLGAVGRDRRRAARARRGDRDRHRPRSGPRDACRDAGRLRSRRRAQLLRPAPARVGTALAAADRQSHRPAADRGNRGGARRRRARGRRPGQDQRQLDRVQAARDPDQRLLTLSEHQR